MHIVMGKRGPLSELDLNSVRNVSMRVWGILRKTNKITLVTRNTHKHTWVKESKIRGIQCMGGGGQPPLAFSNWKGIERERVGQFYSREIDQDTNKLEINQNMPGWQQTAFMQLNQFAPKITQNLN